MEQESFLTDDFGQEAVDTDDQLEGVVERIIFHNESNAFTIIELLSDQDEVIVTGKMPPLNVGETLRVQGEWSDHPKYGLQFTARSVLKQAPRSEAAIYAFLSSGAIKGIGEKTAEKLIDAFGSETLEIMREKPERVARISGIGKKRAKNFQEALQKERSYQELSLLLLPYGIGPSRIRTIYKELGDSAEAVIRQNPYYLAQRVRGIGFETAERLAEAFGMSGDHPVRLRGSLLYTLQQSLFQDGHSFLKEKNLLQNLARRLEVDEAKLHAALDKLVEEEMVVRFDPDNPDLLKLEVEFGSNLPAELDPEKAVIAMRSVFMLEQDLTRTVRVLAGRPEAQCEIDPRYGDTVYCDRVISKAAAQTSFRIDSEEIITPGKDQIKALQMALTAPFSILTGGPGTGKTSTVRLLTRILLADGLEVKLAAPTGRAARRMEEVCQMEATTIHRLLDLQLDDNYIPGIKEYEKIDADYLIIDECSMIDLFLFYRLLKSVDSSTQILLIGDADQLPSIGPGQVLRDLLADNSLQMTRLEEIYRQEKDRLIVRNAHHIIRGEDLELKQSLESDFLFIERDSEAAMLTGVLQLCERILPEDYGIDGIYGAQVVSPIRRGIAGVENLNQSLQEVVQGMNFPHVAAYGKRFAVNDKVMQLQNDYQLAYYDVRTNERGEGVMNGELGVVQEIDLESRSLVVLFEGEHLASISYDQLDNLDLAYATTIHKTQGSEYPVVILVLPQGAPPRFLNRNLLYTAVTRARQRLFILSRRQTLRNMIRTEDANRRHSLLSYFLKLS